ncbi:hypothetical protein Tco_0801180 [Tanacetum coccineum]|uniref:Uncharacterized protein n=1 Tax=Tanacetum coccineum TaxID=301880 RepID=A0ABQ4ZZC1_9ASTR
MELSTFTKTSVAIPIWTSSRSDLQVQNPLHRIKIQGVRASSIWKEASTLKDKVYIRFRAKEQQRAQQLELSLDNPGWRFSEHVASYTFGHLGFAVPPLGKRWNLEVPTKRIHLGWVIASSHLSG